MRKEERMAKEISSNLGSKNIRGIAHCMTRRLTQDESK